MSCDLCGSTGQLNELVAQYKTDDVSRVCDKCESDLTNQHWKIRKIQDGVITTMLKRYLTEKHEDLITKKFKNQKEKSL